MESLAADCRSHLQPGARAQPDLGALRRQPAVGPSADCVQKRARRIARAFHNQLCAHLTTLGSSFIPYTSSPLPSLTWADPSDIDRDISRIIRDLRPSPLRGLGLASSLRAYIDEWSHQSGVSCDLHTIGGQSLPVLVETTIYRIVQEALTNVARHARAQRASVVIAQHRCLTAIVKEMGRFRTQDSCRDSDGRLGLIGMRRTTALPGDCTIDRARAPAPTSSSITSERELAMADRKVRHSKTSCAVSVSPVR